MRKPDFFFLGGPKCGTTALAAYLSDHPLIQMASPKEPHYFCTDLKAGGIPVKSDEDYINTFFPGLEDSKKVSAGDSSVWYLYSTVAVERILKFRSDAKFIVFVRNPSSMAYSLHSMLVFQGQETEENLVEAWRMQKERAQGRSIPKGLWLDTAMLQYKMVCSLGTQLERVYQQVQRERVHVILQEELYRNTMQTYERVLEFLGVPTDGRLFFPKLNAARRFRSPSIAKLLRTKLAIGTASVIKSSLGLKTLGVGRPELPMERYVATFLSSEFEREVEKLEGLLHRDLSCWREK